MGLFVCVCVRVWTCIFVSTCLYVYVCIYICMCVFTCLYVCVCIYVSVCVRVGVLSREEYVVWTYCEEYFLPTNCNLFACVEITSTLLISLSGALFKSNASFIQKQNGYFSRFSAINVPNDLEKIKFPSRSITRYEHTI